MTKERKTIPAPPPRSRSLPEIATAEIAGNQRAHSENEKLRAKIERLESKIVELEANAAVVRNRTRYTS